MKLPGEIVRKKWVGEMQYRGVVRGNSVILEEGASLPEGAPVVVELEKRRSRKPNFSQDHLSLSG